MTEVSNMRYIQIVSLFIKEHAFLDVKFEQLVDLS